MGMDPGCQRAVTAQAVFNLGYIRFETGKLHEAALLFERTIALDKHDVDAMVSLGNTLRLLQQPARAAQLYKSVLEVAPANAMAHHNLGSLLLEQGEAAEALACFTKVRSPHHQLPTRWLWPYS
jgi:Tfp pilus assembly protein PilF